MTMAQPPNTGAFCVRAVALAVTALVAAGCAGASDPFPELADHPRQPQEAPIVAPRRLPDTRGVALGRVPGAPVGPYPVTVHGGDASFTGQVTGPGGPVAGARVLLERFVGGRAGRLEVRTDSRGTWYALNIHGGRYRVRAWRSPDLGMPSSHVLFIPADEPSELDLEVGRYDGSDLTAEAGDTAPDVGATVTVTALATRQQVGGSGIISTVPASGRTARVLVSGPWTLTGAPEAVIDAAGRVSWTLTCRAAGPVSARIDAIGTSTTVGARCEEPPPPPPPVIPPDPDFPVGASFTPPFAGPVPAGRYEVIDDPGTCALTFQAWVGDGWDPARRTVTGTGEIVLPEIARDLRPLGDSPPCTYRRVA
jgi:hypothetical protein